VRFSCAASSVPLIVGSRNLDLGAEQYKMLYDAGADVVVIGTALKTTCIFFEKR
jgi:heptaprenylglyceryl phosphate synthase